MKKLDLAESLNYLSDSTVNEADEARSKPLRRRGSWVKYAALAACAALVVSAGIYLGRGTGLPVEPQPENVVTEPTGTTEPDVSILPATQSDVTEPNVTTVPSNITEQNDTTLPDTTAEPTGTTAPGTTVGPTDTAPNPATEPVDGELPKLVISLGSVGYGFEGYWAYDISELTNNNPWSEDVIVDTLPVYKNHTTWYPAYLPDNVDYRKMVETLNYYAELYSFDMQNLEIVDDDPHAAYYGGLDEYYEMFGVAVPDGAYQPDAIEAAQNGITIRVIGEYGVTVWFEPTIELPDEYNINYFMSYEDAEKAAEYLKIEYADWIDIDDPLINITGGDYNIYADQKHDIEFYAYSGSLEERIINYNFRSVKFNCDDSGNLYSINYDITNLDNKLGDYPIITVGEAYEMLSEGKYITTVPYDMPSIEYVRKVELIYRSDKYDEYYIPYYKFYVEIEAEGNVKETLGLNTYGAYYVPAVAPEYIDEMTVWDGHFN